MRVEREVRPAPSVLHSSLVPTARRGTASMQTLTATAEAPRESREARERRARSLVRAIER